MCVRGSVDLGSSCFGNSGLDLFIGLGFEDRRMGEIVIATLDHAVAALQDSKERALLDFSGTALGDKGAEQIAIALERNSSLKKA